MSISYEMVDLGNGFTKIVSLGGNGQEILCLEKNHEENSMSISYEMVLRKWFHKNSVTWRKRPRNFMFGRKT